MISLVLLLCLYYTSPGLSTDVFVAFKNDILLLRDADQVSMEVQAWYKVRMSLPDELSFPMGLTFDSERKRLYVATQRDEGTSIFSLQLNKENSILRMDTLLTKRHAVDMGTLAYDPKSKQLYWTSLQNRGIYSLRVPDDPSLEMNKPILVYEGVTSSPRGIAIDSKHNALFWSENSQHHHAIKRCNLDNSNIRHLREENESNIYYQGVFYDCKRQELIWAETVGDNPKNSSAQLFVSSKSRKIRIASIDKSYPYDLVADDKYIYWSDWGQKGVMRLSRKPPHLVEKLVHCPQIESLKGYHRGAYGVAVSSSHHSCDSNSHVTSGENPALADATAVARGGNIKSDTVSAEAKESSPFGGNYAVAGVEVEHVRVGSNEPMNKAGEVTTNPYTVATEVALRKVPVDLADNMHKEPSTSSEGATEMSVFQLADTITETSQERELSELSYTTIEQHSDRNKGKEATHSPSHTTEGVHESASSAVPVGKKNASLDSAGMRETVADERFNVKRPGYPVSLSSQHGSPSRTHNSDGVADAVLEGEKQHNESSRFFEADNFNSMHRHPYGGNFLLTEDQHAGYLSKMFCPSDRTFRCMHTGFIVLLSVAIFFCATTIVLVICLWKKKKSGRQVELSTAPSLPKLKKHCTTVKPPYKKYVNVMRDIEDICPLPVCETPCDFKKTDNCAFKCQYSVTDDNRQLL